MRALARLLAVVAWFLAVPCLAAESKFDQATFDALLKSGRPALVMVHADWCPTCRAQAPIVSDLLKTPQFAAIKALRVDFDGQADVAKAFKATQQSTLIVFKGGHEVGRSIGDTRREGIEALLKRAL